MTKELSDDVKFEGKAVLKRGPPNNRHLLYLDRCHAEVMPQNINGAIHSGNLSVQLGELAALSGYDFNSEFEFEIYITPRGQAEQTAIEENRTATYHENGAGHFNYLAGKLGCKEGETFRYKIIVMREPNAESNSP